MVKSVMPPAKQEHRYRLAGGYWEFKEVIFQHDNGYPLTGFSSGYWILQITFQDSKGLIQNTKQFSEVSTIVQKVAGYWMVQDLKKMKLTDIGFYNILFFYWILDTLDVLVFLGYRAIDLLYQSTSIQKY